MTMDAVRPCRDAHLHEAGVYDATVTVTDAAGVVTTSESIRITVLNPPGNAPPNVEAAADPIRGTAPLAVQFSSTPRIPTGTRR